MPPGLLETLLNWVPAVLLLAAYIFLLRRMGYGKQQKEALEIQRRQTDALERIAAALERRSL
jgi:hypothetical protein